MKCSEITYRPLSEMVLLESNPRTIKKADMDRLVDSIKIYGFWKHRPITLSDRTGKLVVIAGNQRLKAAKKLKLKEVPTVVYSDLTEDEEKNIISGTISITENGISTHCKWMMSGKIPISAL